MQVILFLKYDFFMLFVLTTDHNDALRSKSRLELH